MSAVPQVVAPPQPQVAPAPPPPVKISPPKRSRWWWLIAVLVGAVVAIAVYRAKTSEAVRPAPALAIRTATVQVGNVERTTRVAGQTAAIDFSTVMAPSL